MDAGPAHYEDGAGLAKTLAAYNQNAKQGKDPEHKRKDIVPIEGGPYYAIKTVGVLFTTMGGVRTNVNLQALDASGRVIPGLYAVGEVMGMGQTMGDGLCGGFGNGVCITFGRLAARHAVMQARVCAVAEGGRLSAESSHITAPAAGRGRWWAAGFGLRTGWQLAPGLTLTFGGDALIPLVRDEFFIRGRGVIHRPSELTGRALLGLESRLK